MAYMGDDQVDELLHFADHFLLEAGINRGARPNFYNTPHKLGETSIDYVPRTNTVVFRGASQADMLEIEEDAVKTLSEIYAGIHDDFTWDSQEFFEFERALEELPDQWVVPFRDTSIDADFSEMRVGSELWKRRSETLTPLIENVMDQVDRYRMEYDQVVEPLESLEKTVSPNEEDGRGAVSEYFGSDVKNFIEEVKAGKRELYHNQVDQHRHELYQRADVEPEKVDQLLNRVEEALPRIEETVDRIYDAEEKFVEAFEWELEDMLEEKRPDPAQQSVAYMIPLLVHGRMEGTEMHDENLRYIESLEHKSDEISGHAQRIYNEFLNLPTTEYPKPTDRFAQAVENAEIGY